MTSQARTTAPIPSPVFQPSPFQQAIYDEVATGSGHLVVIARAGSGKTSTTLAALSRVPRGCTIAMFAFNKSIATELSSRAPKGVEVKTLHAHGFAACRKAFPGTRIDDRKSWYILTSLFGDETGKGEDEDPVRSYYASIVKIVRYAKDTLASEPEALDEIADRFDVEVPEDDISRNKTMAAAAAVLEKSKEQTDVIDFSDMCWLPVVRNLRVWAFDRVFVDETQDLSPAQIELLLKCVKRGGRIVAVGDDRQAIYSFRGADVDTVDRLIERLSAKVLPLSVTYRCPTAIVELARYEVRDLRPASGAKAGLIVMRTEAQKQATVDEMREGDMVISRSNAPLLSLCFALWKRGRRAKVMGRSDMGESLLKLVRKSKASTVEDLLAWNAKRADKEIARLAAAKRPTDLVEDTRDCLVTLCNDVDTIAELETALGKLFADNPEAGAVTLGTTHKLKGLEAETVYMLEDTYRRERGGEEANCWYVAVTRSKERLVMMKWKEITTKGGANS